MRNLKNVQHLEAAAANSLRPTACAWDVTNDSLVCTYGPNKDDILIELKRWHLPNLQTSTIHATVIASWDSPSPHPGIEYDSVLSLKYFSDSSLSCIVLAGGDIVAVRESPSEYEEKIEIVGSVDRGISAAEWSPDGELLALVTKADTILYMTRDFDVITNTSLAEDDLAASKHVSVGWGKSETQFKGRGAKALQDPTIPKQVHQGLASPFEDQRTTISWRGDGHFVAVSSVQAASRRVIRIYSREGTLDGVSEPVDCLEGALSWRPSGNILASVQRSVDQLKVVFFERNGLRHGDFPLRLKGDDLSDWGSWVALAWNLDSSVLAVIFNDRIQLWTMGNYHYYLKQELHIAAAADVSEKPFLSWHPERPLLVAANLGGGSLRYLEYVWNISKSLAGSSHESGTVAVTDGSTIKLTPFRTANVPPPMSVCDIRLEELTIDTAIWDQESSTTRIAALTKTKLHIFSWTASSNPENVPESQLECPLSELFTLGAAQNSSYVWPQQIIFLGSARTLQILASDGIRSVLYVASISDGNVLKLQERIELDQTREILAAHSEGTIRRFVTSQRGEVFNIEGVARELVQSLSLPVVHTEVVAVSRTHSEPRPSEKQPEIHDLIVTLTQSNSLYANDISLATNCTSFLTTTSHLIFTTSQHLLKFVHVGGPSELEIPPDTPEDDERCRSIERGARLVTVIPSTSALVLQMPRGNLETIYPRALVLAQIRRHLKLGAFKKAFMYCRSHRVDMNILHDHDSQYFLSHVASFIDQVAKIENIDLFLSQLRNEDVAITMYKETIKQEQQLGLRNEIADKSLRLQPATVVSKVNTICDTFLGILEQRRGAHVQNIITAHCCKDPPDLDSGLLEVSRIQRQDYEEAEKAVEHICFLVDVNRLYDTALGLYDLDLTLLVAQQSQKDPREYLPFLQGLRDQSSLRMRFSIDNHLGRRALCLEHLQGLGSFEEFREYTVLHGLYEEALALCRYKESDINAILKCYADHLYNTSTYYQAGLAYEYLTDYGTASEAYRLAHKWQESLTCASLVPFPRTQILELARLIANSLVELKSFNAAATIYLDYLADIQTATRLFCKGYNFAEAIRAATLHNRMDILEEIIDIGLAEGMATMTGLIAECKAQLEAQVPRIRELRLKKLEAPLTFFDADMNSDANIPDNVSLAGTDVSTASGSLFTRYTTGTGTVLTNTTRQTSKNRRREERKKARGKRGSVYEEEYLVNSVGRLFERVSSVHDDVDRLVSGLLRRGMRERAIAVESAMRSVIEACKGCATEVFHDATGLQGIDGHQLPATVGAKNREDFFDFDRTPLPKVTPDVRAFEKISLLSS